MISSIGSWRVADLSLIFFTRADLKKIESSGGAVSSWQCAVAMAGSKVRLVLFLYAPALVVDITESL